MLMALTMSRVADSGVLTHRLRLASLTEHRLCQIQMIIIDMLDKSVGSTLIPCRYHHITV
jgi:hypothetical protein